MTDERQIHLAWTYLDTGRPERALEELGPLIAAEPDRAELLVLGAQAAVMAGDLVAARGFAARAVELAPDDVVPLLVRSQVDAASFRLLDAAKAAAAAVRLAPEDWRTHAQVIRVDLAAGTIYRTTTAAAETMLRLAPGRQEAQALAGHLAAARRRPRTAERHFRTALAIDPAYGGAQEGLARLAAGRLRFGPAVETAGGRLAVDPTDRVGKRLLDALTARLVAPALLGPPLVAFLLWRALRPSETVPAAVWGARTMLADYPFVLLLPAALVVWTLLQAVLLHRATNGAVWQDVRELPARGAAVVLLAIGVVILVSIGVLADAPVVLARQVLLGEAGSAAVALAVTVVVSGAMPGRRRARPAAVDDAVLIRARALLVLAALAPPIAAGVVLALLGSVPYGDPSLIGRTVLSWRPATVLPVVLGAPFVVLALAVAHRTSGGTVWSAVRGVRAGLVVVVVVLGLMSLAVTAWSLTLPVRLGGGALAALLIGWALVLLVGLLLRSRAQRLARR